MENLKDQKSSELSSQKEQINIQDGINKLKGDIEKTTSFRSSLCVFFNVSQNKSKNNSIQNFTLWIIDGLMEFPIIVEMYVNNAWFRDLLWQEFKKISFSNVLDSITDIWNNLKNGDFYDKGKASVRTLLLFSGIAWLLRQFGYTVIKTAWDISIKNVIVGVGLTGSHWLGYATQDRFKDTIKEKVNKIL